MIGYLDATDEMFGIVNSILADAELETLLGYKMDVRWPGRALPSKPDNTRLWARVSKQVVLDRQASLANANGERSFETIGLLFVQLFCPRNQPATLENGSEVAVALQKEFRKQSPSGEIWFRNQAIRELAETDENYPITFVTEFSYNTLDPINVLKGEGVLKQRTVIQIDATHYQIVGSPASLLWFIDGLGQSTPDQYSYANGIVTVPAPLPGGATVLAVGE